jgi:hypothetical protein
MNAKEYNTYGRPATAAELANPGLARCKFYDPERPSDDPDEVIRLQRQRTFAQSRWNGQQEALRVRLTAAAAPAKVVPAPRTRHAQQPAIVVEAEAPAARRSFEDFPLHALGDRSDASGTMTQSGGRVVNF